MIESRASNIQITKGIMYVVITVRPTKDLRRLCESQYEHPGSAIGYWPEMSLGLVLVLEPVGSARLTFDDDRYYEFMCFDVPKVVQSPRYDTDMMRSLEMVET